MADTLDLYKACEELTDFWSPRIVAEVNDTLVKVAKVRGEFAWHDHAHEDELFHVLRGTLVMQYEDRDDVTIQAGEIHLVPRGVRHCPQADEECWIMLVEPAATQHTGDEVTPLTKSLAQQRG
ncbi:MAG: cupin domain-containing protein [Planctomycetota bacterium]